MHRSALSCPLPPNHPPVTSPPGIEPLAQLRVRVIGADDVAPPRQGAIQCYCVLRLTSVRNARLYYTEAQPSLCPRWGKGMAVPALVCVCVCACVCVCVCVCV